MKIKKIRDIFPNINVARFNMAVWQKSGEDLLCLIGREVAAPGKIGEPDSGKLKLFELDENSEIIKEKIIWNPIEGISLEDPRALELPDENLIIGLTAVLRDENGHNIPYPAIVKIESFNSWRDELPPFLIIDTFGPGKNLTPIEKDIYIFRPESSDYFHKLLIFSLESQTPEKLDDIQFPTDLPWASWRIGTTMPPIWLNSNEALFIVHGISIKNIDGKEKYIYNIGRGKLIREKNKFTAIIGKDPILTPDDFLDINGLPLTEELHPESRRVIYSCGGVIKKNSQDILSLYVNVGDKKTFEVELSLNELKKDLF